MNELTEKLKSIDLWMKPVPKDGTSLFRCVSNLLYNTQMKHQSVRTECSEFILKHASQFSNLMSLDKLKEHVRAKLPGGLLEIKALALQYNIKFIIFTSENPNNPITIAPNTYEKIMKMARIDYTHFNIVSNKDEQEKETLCQSILYELLYEKVFGIESCVQKANEMLLRKFQAKEKYHATRSDDTLNEKQSSLKTILDCGKREFSLKIARAISDFEYRNVPLDIWYEQNKDFSEWNNLQVGSRVYVKIENGCREGFIQQLSENHGPITVYLTDLGERVEVERNTVFLKQKRETINHISNKDWEIKHSDKMQGIKGNKPIKIFRNGSLYKARIAKRKHSSSTNDVSPDDKVVSCEISKFSNTVPTLKSATSIPFVMSKPVAPKPAMNASQLPGTFPRIQAPSFYPRGPQPSKIVCPKSQPAPSNQPLPTAPIVPVLLPTPPLQFNTNLQNIAQVSGSFGCSSASAQFSQPSPVAQIPANVSRFDYPIPPPNLVPQFPVAFMNPINFPLSNPQFFQPMVANFQQFPEQQSLNPPGMQQMYRQQSPVIFPQNLIPAPYFNPIRNALNQNQCRPLMNSQWYQHEIVNNETQVKSTESRDLQNNNDQTFANKNVSRVYENNYSNEYEDVTRHVNQMVSYGCQDNGYNEREDNGSNELEDEGSNELEDESSNEHEDEDSNERGNGDRISNNQNDNGDSNNDGNDENEGQDEDIPINPPIEQINPTDPKIIKYYYDNGIQQFFQNEWLESYNKNLLRIGHSPIIAPNKTGVFRYISDHVFPQPLPADQSTMDHFPAADVTRGRPYQPDKSQFMYYESATQRNNRENCENVASSTSMLLVTSEQRLSDIGNAQTGNSSSLGSSPSGQQSSSSQALSPPISPHSPSILPSSSSSSAESSSQQPYNIHLSPEERDLLRKKCSVDFVRAEKFHKSCTMDLADKKLYYRCDRSINLIMDESNRGLDIHAVVQPFNDLINGPFRFKESVIPQLTSFDRQVMACMNASYNAIFIAKLYANKAILKANYEDFQMDLVSFPKYGFTYSTNPIVFNDYPYINGFNPLSTLPEYYAVGHRHTFPSNIYTVNVLMQLPSNIVSPDQPNGPAQIQITSHQMANEYLNMVGLSEHYAMLDRQNENLMLSLRPWYEAAVVPTQEMCLTSPQQQSTAEVDRAALHDSRIRRNVVFHEPRTSSRRSRAVDANDRGRGNRNRRPNANGQTSTSGNNRSRTNNSRENNNVQDTLHTSFIGFSSSDVFGSGEDVMMAKRRRAYLHPIANVHEELLPVQLHRQCRPTR